MGIDIGGGGLVATAWFGAGFGFGFGGGVGDEPPAPVALVERNPAKDIIIVFVCSYSDRPSDRNVSIRIEKGKRPSPVSSALPNPQRRNLETLETKPPFFIISRIDAKNFKTK